MQQWGKTAVEEPPGEKQIDYHENSDQWVSRVGVALVGVAVATALVPPLATAGILLARADFLLGGALLLAATNVIAIQFAFSAIFWVSGYRRPTSMRQEGVLASLQRDFPSIAVWEVLRLARFTVRPRDDTSFLNKYWAQTSGSSSSDAGSQGPIAAGANRSPLAADPCTEPATEDGQCN